MPEIRPNSRIRGTAHSTSSRRVKSAQLRTL